MPRGGFAMRLLKKLKLPDSLLHGPTPRPWEGPGDVLTWAYVVKFAKTNILTALRYDCCLFTLASGSHVPSSQVTLEGLCACLGSG